MFCIYSKYTLSYTRRKKVKGKGKKTTREENKKNVAFAPPFFPQKWKLPI